MHIMTDIKCFGGRQLRIKHDSQACGCEMTFSLFLPPKAKEEPVPLLTWLSGLTCNDENFVTKAGAQRHAAHHQVAILAPDTSPRGKNIPDDPNQEWDFGLGAGFYVDAIKEPWYKNYQMASYVSQELQQLLTTSHFNLDLSRQAIFGHSMGGHGALTLAIKNPSLYQSVSAFAPICSPIDCPWGQKALSNYLGEDQSLWDDYDSCRLIEKLGYSGEILIDQGSDDCFLSEQLKPQLLEHACQKKDTPLTLRTQQGYDHSYFFIASFIEDHIAFHAQQI